MSTQTGLGEFEEEIQAAIEDAKGRNMETKYCVGCGKQISKNAFPDHMGQCQGLWYYVEHVANNGGRP
jgi:hypothetical protein